MRSIKTKRQNSQKSLGILLLILTIPLIVICLFLWINQNTPVVPVQNGIADASAYQAADGPFTLTGQWIRYQGSFTPEELDALEGEEVKDIRNIRRMRGYTYRFTLVLEDTEEWSLLLPRPHSSRLWLNGIEVIGEEGSLSSAEIYPFGDYVEDSEIQVVLQVTNSSLYDVYQGIVIGSRSNLSAIQTRWLVLDLVAAGMSLMLILMCLGLFLPKRSENYLLWLALSTLAELAHFLLVARHPAMSFFRVGSTTFYRQLGFVNIYVCQQFVPEETSKWMNWAVPVVIILTALGCTFWPAHSNDWIRASYLFYMAVQTWILGKGVIHRVPEAPVIMTGCMLALGNELFYQLLYAGYIPQGMIDIEIMPAQYMRFAYVVTLALATCMKYGKKFWEAEHLSADLEKKVQEQTEELRQTNEQLVQTQNNRQRFMTDIVHNLRSPLFAMGGYLDLLRDAIDEPTEEETKYLDMLDRKTEFLGKMTEDMFLIYRLEDGQLQMDKKAFELSRMLEQIQLDAQAKGQEKGIQIQLILEETNSFMLGDRFRLKQAFDNILDNAIRYSPQGGTIFIRQEKVGTEYYISVEDQGPGISEEQQRRLFERYKSKGEGGKTGLGLSISNSIIQMHDGQIHVSSRLGAGSVFTVALPCENFNEISTENED